MDKKTLLAVVLSVVIIVGGMLLQSVLFPAKPQPAQPTTQSAAPAAQQSAASQAQGSSSAPASTAQVANPTATTTALSAIATGTVLATPESAPPASQPETITRDTNLYTVGFSSSGATLNSVKLKKYKNLDGSPVEMLLLPKTQTSGELPFALSFGDYKAEQITVPFTLKESSSGDQSIYDFTRTFMSPVGVPFTLHKTYVFDKNEYLFELRVTIVNSVNDFPGLNFGGTAYTLTMGPQIGPHYVKLDGRNDYRNYAFYADKKRQDPKVGMGQLKEIERRVTWTGIVGKYFTAIAVPDATQYKLVYDSRKLVDGYDRSSVSFERPVLGSATNTDVFRFYMGPMKKDILGRYNDSTKNAFKIADLHADEVVTSSILIGWLATLLQYGLQFFFLLIPNYGVAIILLTLLTKVVFLPLTFRSSESMAKMAELNPKMAEIRTRLKDKPEKMNQEIAELYKKEKINPLSGCLPLLLQIPVFFALYNLLNSWFDLRGAMFISGWVMDLSAPDTVLTLPFAVPLLGWTALRALPILMVLSQIFSSKITQPSSAQQQQGAAQAKLMMYALPVVFFFMLYDMPSGLVLYWTAQNIFSMAQQLYINWYKKRKDAEKPQAPVLVKSGNRSGNKIAHRPGK